MDGTADWDAVSSNWDAGAAIFANGAAAVFDETFDGNSSSVNLVGSLTPGAVLVNNTATGTVPEYVFSGTGNLTGPMGLARSGNGTLTINNSGTNDYTGGTLIDLGTIKLGVAHALPTTSTLTIGGVAGTSTFMLNGLDQTLTALNSAGANTRRIVNGSSTAAILTVSGSANSTYGGQLGNSSLPATDDANNFKVVKSGAGILNLLGGNSAYNGGLSVTGGACVISSDAGLGAVPAGPTADSITLDGGTLRADMSSGTGGSFVIHANRLITLGTGGGTIQTTTPGGAWTVSYDGVISGTGSLTKTSAQALDLGGDNIYTGATTVSAGTLRLTGSLTSAVTVQSGTFVSGDYLTGSGDGTVPSLEFSATGKLACYINTSTISAGKAIVSGAVTIDPAATLILVDKGADVVLTNGTKLTLIDYTGGSLAGTFSGIADGSSVVLGSNTYLFDYDDGTTVTLTANNIVADPYAAWATTNITDIQPTAPAGFDEDADGDGIKNGLVFVLGGNPLVPNSSTLPTITLDATNLTFSYTRSTDSKTSTTQIVQWSPDLANWTDVVIDPGDPDAVNVIIPRSNEADGKLFTRLKATNP